MPRSAARSPYPRKAQADGSTTCSSGIENSSREGVGVEVGVGVGFDCFCYCYCYCLHPSVPMLELQECSLTCTTSPRQGFKHGGRIQSHSDRLCLALTRSLSESIFAVHCTFTSGKLGRNETDEACGEKPVNFAFPQVSMRQTRFLE